MSSAYKFGTFSTSQLACSVLQHCIKHIIDVSSASSSHLKAFGSVISFVIMFEYDVYDLISSQQFDDYDSTSSQQFDDYDSTSYDNQE